MIPPESNFMSDILWTSQCVGVTGPRGPALISIVLPVGLSFPSVPRGVLSPDCHDRPANTTQRHRSINEDGMNEVTEREREREDG